MTFSKTKTNMNDKNENQQNNTRVKPSLRINKPENIRLFVTLDYSRK